MNRLINIFILLFVLNCSGNLVTYKVLPACTLYNTLQSFTMSCIGMNDIVTEYETSGATLDLGVQGYGGYNKYNMLQSILKVQHSSCDDYGYLVLIGLDANSNSLLEANDLAIQSTLLCIERSKSEYFSPIQLLNPCGEANRRLHEDIYIRTASGLLVASFFNQNTRTYTELGVIPPGDYYTADRDRCQFTVNENGYLSNERNDL